MAFTTFIIPTIGRDSLSRTIDSVCAQQDPDFACIIVHDRIHRYYIPPDYRFRSLCVPTLPLHLGIHEGDAPGQSFGGAVRNYGIDFVETDWISFVDDDDTITNDYVSLLKEVQENDVVIFRMLHPSLGVLPPLSCNEIVNGLVGISFSVRKSVLDKYHIRFMNSGIEDYELLMTLQFNKAKIHISPFITYKVRH